MKELIKDIPGFIGLYKISNLGYVVNCKKNTKLFGKGNKNKENSYLRLNLSKEGVKNTQAIHRLVAKAFIHNPENKPEVNHIDGDKTNNRVDNLEWCTHKENIRHAWENNLMENVRDGFRHSKLKGEAHPNSKLTEEEVLKIRDEYGPGNSIYKLAKKYNISKTKIHQIIKRENWKHI